MAGADTHTRKHQESDDRNQAGNTEYDCRPLEDHVRLEHQEAADNRASRLGHVLEDVREQTGFAGLRVGGDGVRRDRNTLVAGLNDGFHAVAELGDDVELEQGVL